MTRRIKNALRHVDRYATAIVNIPPQAHFHTRPYVNWLRVGLPCSLAARARRCPEPAPRPDGTVRILHCPSDPQAKGSAVIRATIERLRQRGCRIEFVEIRNQPNSVVEGELARCDFVVDQVYADYGMPGFATEAAWFARPTVIAGYAVDLWNDLLPPEERPPTLYCYPDELDQAIEKMIRQPEFRRALGRRARSFVEQKWAPAAIAARYLRLAVGAAPQDWICDPRLNDYVFGAAMPADRVRQSLRRLVDHGGRDALQVSDKPELEQRLLNFAETSPTHRGQVRAA